MLVKDDFMTSDEKRKIKMKFIFNKKIHKV